MKTRIALIALMTLWRASLLATPLHGSMRESTGSTLDRTVTVTPLDGIRGFFGTNLVPPVEFSIKSVGGIFDTNLEYMGNYRITYSGLPNAQIIFWPADASITNLADSRIQRSGVVTVFELTKGYIAGSTNISVLTTNGTNYVIANLGTNQWPAKVLIDDGSGVLFGNDGDFDWGGIASRDFFFYNIEALNGFHGDVSDTSNYPAAKLTGTVPQASLGNAVTNSTEIYVYTNGIAWGPNAPITSAATPEAALQAAFYAMPQSTTASGIAGGGALILDFGKFKSSSGTATVTVPNTFPFTFTIRGKGKTATILEDILFNVASDSYSAAPGGSSINCTFEHLCFSDSTTNAEHALVRLFALNEADFDDCLFTKAYCLTNGGAALNYTPPSSRTNKTTGLFASGCNMLRVKNCAFWGLPYGVKSLQAHARIENTIFDGCQDNVSSLSLATDGTYYFPKSAAVFQGDGDMILSGCHWDGATIGVYSAGFVQNINPVFEVYTMSSVVDEANHGLVEVVMPNGSMGAFTPNDKKMSALGVFTPVTDTSVVNHDLGTDALTPIRVNWGGSNHMVLDYNGGLKVDALRAGYLTSIPNSTNVIFTDGATTNKANGDWYSRGIVSYPGLGILMFTWTNVVSGWEMVFDANGDLGSPANYVIGPDVDNQVLAFTTDSIGGTWTALDPTWQTPPSISAFEQAYVGVNGTNVSRWASNRVYEVGTFTGDGGALTNLIKGLSFPTNSSFAPNLNLGNSETNIGAAFTLSLPINVNSTLTMGQRTTFIVRTNGVSGSPFAITTPTGVKGTGTAFVTNTTEVDVFAYGKEFTNYNYRPIY